MITRKDTKQLASSSETNQRIYDFFKSQPIGVLATCDSKGKPYASVMYYHIYDDFSVTFVTKRDTQKNTNLKHNKNVVILAYEAYTQTTAQISGTVEDISDSPEAQEAFKHTLDTAMKTSESGTPPISKLHAGFYIAYKLTPKEIRLASFIRPETGGTNVYEVIEF